MRTIEDHRRDVTALLAPLRETLGSESLPVSGAAAATDAARYTHRVLAVDVVAPSSLPAFDNSQMDGYAVRSVDLADARDSSPVTFPIAPRIAAGDATRSHEPGTATPVMTGAPIPHGADAVVQIERAVPPVFPSEVTGGEPTDDSNPDSNPHPLGGAATSKSSGHPLVSFGAPIDPGTFVRPAGSDIAAGAVLLTAGSVLGAAQFGVIAGSGAVDVTVRRRPRVLLVSTGHEIREAGSQLASGQIYDANTVALTIALLEAGCSVTPAPCRSDDAADLLELVTSQARDHDLVVTVGGVSAGVREVVRDAFGTRGVEFMKVAMQPGGPQGFGLLQLDSEGADVANPTPPASNIEWRATAIPTICLPGNPVSALVSFEAFLRPALRSALGIADPLRERRRARVAHPFDSPPSHHQLRRAVLTADGALQLVGGPSSHLLHSYAASTVLVHVPVGVSAVAAGDELDYWRIDG